MQASAALLLNGTVFVAGGKNFQGQDLNSAEIYDPPTKSFTQLAALMTTPRSGHVGVTLQDNGKVLLLGGTNAGQLVAGVELYDPVAGAFAFDAFQTQSKDIGMSFLATASGPQTNWTAQARFTDACNVQSSGCQPSNLSLTVASATEIDLSWTDNSTNANDFRVERCQ